VETKVPELPEVETVRRGLEQSILGKKISKVEVFHPRATNPKSIAPLDSLTGSKIISVNRRGKFLWLELNRPEVLLAHLGMSGQFIVSERNANVEKHMRVRISLNTKAFEVRFIDQRTFGWLSVDQSRAGIPNSAAHIALDIFDPKFNRNEVKANFLQRKTEIKRALLNQEIMSGVGNIYADESLWLAKIHPERACSELTDLELELLLDSVAEVMGAALKAGGTSFDEQYKNVNGESGYFDIELCAYGQDGEPCSRCGTEIRRIAFANRSSHFCPKCQVNRRSKKRKV
jgi:formamidopyrimidine-DNA glycosylase